MKICFSFLALFLLLGISSNVYSAVVIDSVWADSVYLDVSLGIQSPELTLHEADNQFCTMGNGAQLPLMFKNKAGTAARNIKPKATVNVYCKKDTQVDSSAGILAFFKVDAEGVILYQSSYFLLGDGVNTIIVPDSEYSYVEFQLAGLGNPNGAKSFKIDAVQLIQEEDKVSVPRTYGVSGSRIVSNYPNPFLSGDANGTTLRFSLEREAEVGVVVIDALGRQVSQQSLGMMAQGSQEARVSVPESGMYIARLVIDGEMTSSYYKLIAK